MEGGLWLHLLNRLCCFHTIPAMFIWALSQRRERAEILGPGAHGAFIKTVCCQTSCVTSWDRKQLTFVHIFGGRLDVWTSRVWRSSLARKWSIKACQESFDAHRPKKNTCVKITSEAHVDFLLLLWHQLPHSCKINLTGSSYHMCLEIKTQVSLSEYFNGIELCGFFSPFRHTMSMDSLK